MRSKFNPSDPMGVNDPLIFHPHVGDNWIPGVGLICGLLYINFISNNSLGVGVLEKVNFGDNM